MINRSKASLLIWSSAILIFVCCLVYYLSGSHTDYTYQVYKVKGGFGYQILSNDKLFIQQDFIPTIDGYKAFASEQQATKAAQAVVTKLEENQMPALSVEEIENIIK